MKQSAAPLHPSSAIVGPLAQEYRSNRAETTTDSWAQPSTLRQAGERVQFDTPIRGFINRRSTRVSGIVAAGLLTVALMGCSTDSTSASTTTAANAAETSAEPADAPKPSADPAAKEADPAEQPASDESGIVGPAAEPVAFDAVADFGNGVTSKIVSMAPVSITATMPGETSGPGIEVKVEISNGTDASIDLSGVTVDLADSDGASHLLVNSTNGTGFTGDLEAGATASGTYQYRVDPAAPRDARLTIKYSATTPTVVFAGSIPNE